MKKKYKYNGETKVVNGIKLHRIVAIKSFGCVKKGDLGGWIEKDTNLSHNGNCWVYGNALVYGNARVSDDAWVSGNVEVYGDAKVCGNASVYGDAKVYGNTWVTGDARVSGDAEVYGNARVFGNARVCGNAKISDNAWVSGNAEVYGGAKVYGNARVYGDVRVCCNANIQRKNDILVVSGVGSRLDTTTAYTTIDGIEITCGCFKGCLDEFVKAVNRTHGSNKFGREYKTVIELIKIHFNVQEEKRDEETIDTKLDD